MSDFIYMHSEALDKEIKLDKRTGSVIVRQRHRLNQDNLISYSADELKVLKEAGGITKVVHRVKDIFEGEIVGICK